MSTILSMKNEELGIFKLHRYFSERMSWFYVTLRPDTLRNVTGRNKQQDDNRTKIKLLNIN